MNSFVILCLDDDPTVVQQLQQDLNGFSHLFDILTAQTIAEAYQILVQVAQNNQTVAMVLCDNDLGNDSGIDFLIQLHQHPITEQARTVLLNDKAQLDDIMQAVNEGRLNYCLTKPWQSQELLPMVAKELTSYVLKHPEVDWLLYSQVLEHRRILKAHIDRQMSRFRSRFIQTTEEVNDERLAQQVSSALNQFFAQNDETKARRTYSPGHILTTEGQPNAFLWFISQGEVALYKKDEQNKQHEVVRVGAGHLVGGMSFMTGEVSFSTGITQTATDVIKLDQQLFTQVMNSQNELLPLFTNLLLRNFNRRLQGSIQTEMKLQQTLQSLDDAYHQLIDKEKMAMLGQLVAGVAHELNNPVSAILRGSDTLKETIIKLTDSQLSLENQQRGNIILQQAMHSRPLSTSDARAKAKELQSQLGDRQLARKAVQMGLDDPEFLTDWLLSQKKDLPQVMAEWDNYYQMGNFLRSINVCAQRIADLVKSLKSYARQDDESQHMANIHEGIEDTLIIFDNKLKRNTVIKNYANLPEICCQPIALQQVWTNLIANALDAIEQPGEIIITTQYSTILDNAIDVIFQDNGKGIPAELQRKIFELNYTTKREGNFGLGIGLSVCQQIVNQHQGRISVESKSGCYTKMIVTLPISLPFNQQEAV